VRLEFDFHPGKDYSLKLEALVVAIPDPSLEIAAGHTSAHCAMIRRGVCRRVNPIQTIWMPARDGIQKPVT
jgi:hypothetical protein